MSKSKPDSMISIHDTVEEVQRKMKKAYCPEKTVEGNPIIEMCKFVIFPELENDVFCINRPEKFGGNLEFSTYDELEQAFISGLHPLDLKNATTTNLNNILEPIRDYFNRNSERLEKMKELGVIH